jgi:hypothetical protein
MAGIAGSLADLPLGAGVRDDMHVAREDQILA